MAKCKHENADHVGPDERFTAWSWIEHFICIDCGTWLSLGEANDSLEAVRVEIRAAELAAGWTKERGTLDGATLGEDVGWLIAFVKLFPDNRSTPMNDEQWAGYLARCIATHTEGT